jgi:hypothetical protein
MSMGEKIGYPPYILDSKALEHEYDGVRPYNLIKTKPNAISQVRT